MFYRSIGEREPQLIMTAVRTAPAFSVLSRRALFSMADVVCSNPHATFDLSPDGKTFVLVRRTPPARITIIQNLAGLVEALFIHDAARLKTMNVLKTYRDWLPAGPTTSR